MEEIVNRVANSALAIFDLEDYYPKGPRYAIDISQWLFEGFVLREKEFREALKNYDWSQYKDGFVALHCTTEAIVPSWAYMLITTYLSTTAKKTYMGSITQLETSLYQEILETIDYSEYTDKPTIIKGCSQKPVPQEVMSWRHKSCFLWLKASCSVRLVLPCRFIRENNHSTISYLFSTGFLLLCKVKVLIMRKVALIMFCIFGMINTNAQENPTMIPDSLRHWNFKGNFVLMLNQAAFNNDWQSGGTSSFSGNIGLNYDFNYKRNDWIWENKFIGAYGSTKIKGNDKPTKTDDRLEFNSILGKKASKYWYYTLFFNFQTQMDSGYDKDFNRLSHFFSPAYFQLGPGMLWKRSEIAKVNFAPVTSRLIIVHDEFTEFGPAFGVEQGETTRYEFGASISGYYKFAVMPNVYMENNLNLYSNYLEKPQNVDINYQVNLVMKVNQYISTNVTFQAIYDDNAIGAFQIREVMGFGINTIF